MNDPTTLKRPKPCDGEEELFRMQDEFIRTKQEPSAKVINLRSQAKTIVPMDTEVSQNVKPAAKIRSKFAERRALAQQQKFSTSQSDGPIINPDVQQTISQNENSPISDPVQNLPLNPSSIILGRIVEKRFAGSKNLSEYSERTFSDSDHKGFPDVFLIDKKVFRLSFLFINNSIIDIRY